MGKRFDTSQGVKSIPPAAKGYQVAVSDRPGKDNAEMSNLVSVCHKQYLNTCMIKSLAT